MPIVWPNLTQDQARIVEDALARCTVKLERLQRTVTISFEDLSRWAQAVASAKHGQLEVIRYRVEAIGYRSRVLGLAWYDGRVMVDVSLVNDPLLAREVLMSELAHQVDFDLFTEAIRRQITDIVHPQGPDSHLWFDSPDYWDDVGEAWMALFVEGFCGMKATLGGFTHPYTPEQLASIVKLVQPPEPEPPEPEPEPEPPPEPEPEEPMSVFEFLRQLLRRLLEWLFGR